MERHVLIVAGGTGRRMRSAVPKQFLPLAGRPLLMHTIERMHLLCGGCGITVVLPGEFRTMWEGLCGEHRFAVPHTLVDGGEERFYSVKRGLEGITGDCLVAIHDGVRPLVSAATVERCFAEAAGSGAAIPVVAPPESVRMVTVRGTMTVNRESIRLVQTPQVFRLDLIKRAYELNYNPMFTDDATVAEQAGIPVSVVEGNRENIKITTPFDMVVAEAIMRSEREATGL